MATILDLPNEILERAVDYVPPADIVNLALSHSIIAAAATCALELHQKRIRKYQHLTFKGCHTHEDDLFLSSVLTNICNIDALSYYPRTITMELCPLAPCTYSMYAEGNQTSFVREQLKRLSPAILKHVEETGYLNEDEVNQIPLVLDAADRSAMLALLLLFLPNLESLTVVDDHLRTDVFQMVINAITSRKGNQKMSLKPEYRALTRLAGFHIYGDPIRARSNRDGDLGILAALARLPSLRSISGTDVSNGHRAYRPLSIVPRSSNLEVLRLRNSCQRADNLRYLLYETNALRELHLVVHSFCDVDTFLQWLLEFYAKATLEILSMVGARGPRASIIRHDSPDTGSLCGFQVLKQARLPINLYVNQNIRNLPLLRKEGLSLGNDWSAAWKEWEPGYVRRLTSILPRSLERLELDGEVGIGTIKFMLEGLVQGRVERHPFLKQIVFHDVKALKSNADRAVATELMETFAKVDLAIDMNCLR